MSDVDILHLLVLHGNDFIFDFLASIDVVHPFQQLDRRNQVSHILVGLDRFSVEELG